MRLGEVGGMSLCLDLAILGKLKKGILRSARNTIQPSLSPAGKFSQLVKTFKNSSKYSMVNYISFSNVKLILNCDKPQRII